MAEVRLRLDKESDIVRRIPFIIKFLSRDYTIRFIGKRRIDPRQLYSTESCLESDKLGLVLRAVLYENYDAPIIVILGYMGRLYIFDGHHRSRVALWLNKYVDAYLLQAPSYKPRIQKPLYKTPIVNPPVAPSNTVINTWKHMVNIITFLELKHNTLARIMRACIRINELIATQPLTKPVTRLYNPKTDPPILVYEYDGKYYVIDGHTRVCSALITGLECIESIIFTFNKPIGIIKISKYFGEPAFTHSYCYKRSLRKS